MKKAIITILVFAFLFSFSGCVAKSSDWQEQYDLGCKYLSEGKYEEAIIAFEAAIKIEPKKVDAYKSLADVYIAMGDTEQALQVLNVALQTTKDESIQVLINELSSGANRTDNLVPNPVEITLGGKTFMSDVYELDLSNCGITDISLLSQCLNLERLNLNSNKISDIDALGNLKNLMKLTLNFNRINDISALGELNNLELLSIDGRLEDNGWFASYTGGVFEPQPSNKISNITALSKLTHLHYLYLDYNQIDDISSLTTLNNLVELSLAGNKISDINVLNKMSELRHLVLAGNLINDIKPLKELSLLTNLDLGGNQINDISVLSNLCNLSKLYLTGNQIRDISELRNLTQLETLCLENNQISDYSAVEFVPNLNK